MPVYSSRCLGNLCHTYKNIKITYFGMVSVQIQNVKKITQLSNRLTLICVIITYM